MGIAYVCATVFNLEKMIMGMVWKGEVRKSVTLAKFWMCEKYELGVDCLL